MADGGEDNVHAANGSCLADLQCMSKRVEVLGLPWLEVQTEGYAYNEREPTTVCGDLGVREVLLCGGSHLD